MSDKDLQLKKADVYLGAYNNYMETQRQMEKLVELQESTHKVLCEAAGLFLGLSESEMTRILFYWDSIAADAKVVLGVEE